MWLVLTPGHWEETRERQVWGLGEQEVLMVKPLLSWVKFSSRRGDHHKSFLPIPHPNAAIRVCPSAGV